MNLDGSGRDGHFNEDSRRANRDEISHHGLCLEVEWEERKKERKEGKEYIPIASPGLTISRTIPIVSDVRLGEWGVLATSQP
jgi:hypothetical protein